MIGTHSDVEGVSCDRLIDRSECLECAALGIYQDQRAIARPAAVLAQQLQLKRCRRVYIVGFQLLYETIDLLVQFEAARRVLKQCRRATLIGECLAHHRFRRVADVDDAPGGAVGKRFAGIAQPSKQGQTFHLQRLIELMQPCSRAVVSQGGLVAVHAGRMLDQVTVAVGGRADRIGASFKW